MTQDQSAYTHEEVCARFTAWASLPTNTYDDIKRRNDAWCAYVDARDNLPEGTTKNQWLRRRAERSAQLEIFTRN